MDSTINLLPEKDKQLKRDAQRKPSSEMVEMTKPQDRVFQERVVRMEGVLSFFKNIFRRAPKLPQPKVKEVLPPPPPKPAPAPQTPAAPVTKLETMMDRLSPTQAPKPPAPPPAGNFLTKMFSKAEKPASPLGGRPPLVVPQPPSVPVKAPTPAPIRRAPSWAPPPPPPARVAAPPVKVPAGLATPPPPAAKPPLPPVQFPAAPAPGTRAAPPAAPTTNAQPLLGASLNVNLVPEQYQPQASGRDRLFALLSVVVAIVLVGGATVGLILYERHLQTKVKSVDEQIAIVSKDVQAIENVELREAQVLQQRTADIEHLLDQHVYWDAFFQKLESVTLPGVSYSSMSIDVNGTLSLTAYALTYDDVGKQLLAYENAKDFITEVTINSATMASIASAGSQAAPNGAPAPSQARATFNVAIRVSPSIFYR